MIGVDTNILVYCHRGELAEHARARELLTELAEGSRPWAVTWSSFYEFVRVVTHPRLFSPPSSLDEALTFLERVKNAPSCEIIGPTPMHWEHFLSQIKGGDARGNLAFDAQIAATMVEHGVVTLMTHDSDFLRFRDLKVVGLT